MSKKVLFLVFLTIIMSQVYSQNASFHFNTIGYLPNQAKVAGISGAFEKFEIVNQQTMKTVFKGKAQGPFEQDNFDSKVWLADFSKLKKAGSYQIKLDNGQVSPTFVVSDDVYNHAFTTSMRAFYLWRCGTNVSGEYNGITYQHDVCHANDGYLDYIGQPGVQKDGTGGWHDAGDHGKYVVNASITVGLMFYAWEHFNDKLIAWDFNLPETAPGYPQYLKELKWETDWLLKMQYPDGSGRVSHKLTRTNFSGMIMPDDDDEKRYFTEWSSAATAGFVGMMAQAARYFEPYDKVYAQKCLDAAKLSYKFLAENPEHQRFNQGDFRTGGYQSHDADDRLWAAAEMWETTGDALYLNDFEARMKEIDVKVDENWDWGNIKNMGVFTYVLSKREGRNVQLLEQLKTEIVNVADAIVIKSNEDIYRRPLGKTFYWGCNGTVARQVLNLQVANMLNPKSEYKQTALNAIHHLFGSNSYARSFVTGLGHNPPMFPHDRRSSADGIEAPWPGYIVGGGTKANDWVDVEASYSTNEVAINWQAALVYALAGFIQ
ncbi:MAG: glycoside hydrolase family 9 protein [Prolixibacteraceae bacterium]|nr:glycoside hydrolase family 9 protein [Prolixibacteraceae bacterium]